MPSPAHTIRAQLPAAAQAFTRLRKALPQGQTLPDNVWLKRHRALVILLSLHALALPVFALIQSHELIHSFALGIGLALTAALAYRLRDRRRLAATLVSVGLVSSSALAVHVSGGVIEAHFHFFVMVIVLSLYEDWVPFLIAAAYVVLHHGLTSVIDPHAVYNHPDAIAHPWKWAAIHGAFVTAAGIAAVVAWRLNEDARAATKAASRKTRRILETARDAFIAIDEAGVISDCNPRAEETFGWSSEKILGREAELLVPERNRDAFRHGIAQLLTTGGGPLIGERLELTALHRDGHEFPVELTISALRTEEGYTFNSFLRDITDRKAAEEQLEGQHRRLIEAQAIGGVGSWEWDIARDTIEWSDQLCRIYGLEPGSHPAGIEEVLERTYPDDRDALEAGLQEALETGEPFSSEQRILRPDGTVRITHARGEVIADDDGTAVRMLGTAQDVTEQRELERTKDEFTSVVSHELRTPLTSIRGSLGLLESGVLGGLPEKGQRMVEIAVENTDRLVRLINDILDIERIDSGEVAMHKQRCDAADLIARAIETLQPLAADAQVTLCAEGAPLPVFADPDRVLQALTNLTSNALKFSPPESTVRVSCARRDGEVLFEVIDEGRGIPPDKLDTIFERFQQVDASDSREKGGTGLGLAICRTIVENHEGRIWVESVPGEGSTFSFTLPALGAPERAHDGHAAPGAPVVLICDDDASVTEVVGAILGEHGYSVIKATSGEEALERAIADQPDAVLLDLLMPGMSGWETAAMLGEHPKTKEIPIVILSVLTRDEAEEQPGDPVDWLAKPVDERALFQALERAVGPRKEQFKVLIVEDDGDLARVLMAIFESHGMKTFTATSGQEAIALSQRVLPDLLVLDVGLPEADGFEVVDWLRRHERLSALPLVVYSARDLDHADRERLRLGDATEFLTKGRISPDDFERRVMALLARLTHNPAAERRRDEPEAHPVG